MDACAEIRPEREMLPNPVSVRNQGAGFDQAREIAYKTANERLKHPMLLGWYNDSTGEYSPRVECCSEEKPGWVVYAESRGGAFTVDVNDGEFYFIYMDLG
ncbi:MAG: AF1514 family protein [Desulfobacteraceae bacterium]